MKNGWKYDYGYGYCGRCGDRFEKSSANAKHCRRCKPISIKEKRRERYLKEADVERVCVHCGAKFKSKSGRGKYCPKHRSEVMRAHIWWTSRRASYKRKGIILSDEESCIYLIGAMVKSCPGPTEEPCETCFFDTMCPHQRFDYVQCADAKIVYVG